MPKLFPMTKAKSSEIARVLGSIPLTIPQIAARLGRTESTVYRWRRGETEPSLGEFHLMRAIAAEFVRSADGKPDFRFIDLFAGIGGMRLGVESVGGQCVFSCERD